MMDPEMIRLAQEQMNRIPPSELNRMQQQVLSNPDLMQMAMDSFKNMKPDELRFAAEQMKNIKPEEMAEMSSRMSNISPQNIAAMKVQADAQASYEIQGALSLKNQGNDLHRKGKYDEAIGKYYRAKQNLSNIPKPEAASLRLTCSLNLMSCYLKTGEFDKAVEEGTQVLERDPENLKALYRRGQAHRELGKLKLAFADLEKATKVAPDDETVKDVFRQVKDQIGSEPEPSKENVHLRQANGPIIEEITEAEADRISKESRRNEENRSTAPTTETEGQTEALPNRDGLTEAIENLKQNPEMIRSMFSMMNSLSPEQIAAVSGGQMTPEMARMASDMSKQMSPDDMQRMFDMMPSLRNQGVSNVSGDSSSNSTQNPSSAFSERSSMITPELQEQMRQQMKDPAMKQMMASMLQNMTPDSMVSMGQQMGFKISQEDAEKAQRWMSSMTPEDVEKMMKWADRAQKAVDVARKSKDYLLGRKGLILAFIMLILAIVLHYFGVIGG